MANRLEDADFYYIDAGENVAFSETFVAEFIHKSLFESGKGHRENMLDPNYTQVGIGIIQRDHKRYYVTQDFLHPLVKKSSEQAGQIILERINTERHSVELPPLKLWKEAEKFAQKLATRKAKGLALPDIPPEFGETLVVFLFMPGLIQEEFLFSDAVNPRYNRGALGIWFGKNRDYPGGIYTLSLLLFAENRQDSLSLSDQRKFILELVNKIRKRFDLKVFILDDGLNGTAQRVAVQAAERTSRNILLFPKHNRYEHLTYGTEDLSLLPASLDSIVKKSRLRKIGIGLVHKKSRSALAGTFFISLILE